MTDSINAKNASTTFDHLFCSSLKTVGNGSPLPMFFSLYFFEKDPSFRPARTKKLAYNAFIWLGGEEIVFPATSTTTAGHENVNISNSRLGTARTRGQNALKRRQLTLKLDIVRLFLAFVYEITTLPGLSHMKCTNVALFGLVSRVPHLQFNEHDMEKCIVQV